MLTSGIPTPSQITARQAIPRELPAFGRSERLNYHLASEEPLRVRGKCVICDAGDHKIQTCPNFSAMITAERWDVSRTHHLCLNCLNKHRSLCISRKTCNINNCCERHHPLYRAEHQRQPTAPELESGHILAHRHADQTNFRIVPIKIDYKTQQINTFAYLDEGSSVTLIEETIFQKLGVTGVPHPLCLKWTDNTTHVEETSKTATLRVINTQIGAKFKLRDARSVRSLNLPMQSANMKELAMKFPYFKGLPIASYANVRPTIIVGADNWNLAVPLRIREGAWRQPIASKTRLGWTLQIPPNRRSNPEGHVNIHECRCYEADTALHEAIKQTFAVETPRRAHLYSEADYRAIAIMNLYFTDSFSDTKVC